MDRRRSSIIIVDDDPVIRKILHRKLSNLGINEDDIKEVQDGDELTTPRPGDLLIMDNNMERVNGIQATQKIRKKSDDATIIAHSTTNEDDKQEWLDAGVDGFLPKKSNTQDIKKIIDFWEHRNTIRD